MYTLEKIWRKLLGQKLFWITRYEPKCKVGDLYLFHRVTKITKRKTLTGETVWHVWGYLVFDKDKHFSDTIY